MGQQLQQRFFRACRDLYRDAKRGFDSGTNLIGIIEMPNGKPAQLHVSIVTDEMEFIDVDKPTGCADDLVVQASDFQEKP